MEIRKQVYHLTLDDLSRHPAWEYALDEEGEEGQDEATVRPYQSTPPIDPGDGLMAVRARFTLADGAKMEGYLQPQPPQQESSLGYIQPIIITDQGQVRFWYGMSVLGPDEISESYRLLGKSPSQVFPLNFEAAVAIMGGLVKGTLQGFYYYKSFDDAERDVATVIK